MDDKKYCQSCGMPLDIEGVSEYGTNSDGTPNPDYCSCCLKSGKYLFDFSMDYLIYLWGLFPSSYNQVAGTTYDSNELRAILSERLPKLKRWRQKLDTVHTHYGFMIKVQAYINRHLFDDLDSTKLSKIACMSVYHFRRVFREAVGENVGDYIQRLRIEYIAFKLITTDYTVSQLLSYINYENKHTVSRAFKKHFQMTIPEFRKVYAQVPEINKYPCKLSPTTRILGNIKVIFLKFERTHRSHEAYSTLWRQVLKLAEEHNLISNGYKFVSLSLDNLDMTDNDKGRFLIGITTPSDFIPPKGFEVYEIPSGRYAVTRVNGRYYEMDKVYRELYLDWLPSSKYRLRDQFSFEMYINMPFASSEGCVVTEIYLPIEFNMK